MVKLYELYIIGKLDDKQRHAFLCFCSQVWFKINVGTMNTVRVGLFAYPGLAFIFEGAIVPLFSVLIEYAAYSDISFLR